MSRTFDGTADKITVGLGEMGFVFGPGSIAAIVKKAADGATRNVLWVGGTPTANARAGLGFTSGNVLRLVCGSGSNTPASLGVTTADNWVFVAVTKASGSVKPIYYKYVYDTNTWSTQTSGSNRANSNTMITNGWIGGRETAAEFFSGDIAAGGVWNAVLTEEQLKSMAFSLQAWFQVDPKGMWLLDQSLTTQNVSDLTGGGANQTALVGTSVSTSSVPVFSYGHPVLLPSRVSAAVFVPRYGFVNYQDPGML